MEPDCTTFAITELLFLPNSPSSPATIFIAFTIPISIVCVLSKFAGNWNSFCPVTFTALLTACQINPFCLYVEFNFNSVLNQIIDGINELLEAVIRIFFGHS